MATGALEAECNFLAELAVDHKESGVETFGRNHKASKAVAASVTDLTPGALDEFLDLNNGKKFAPIGVIGGPPCQSFSVSNVYQKDDDHRHSLPEHYAKLLGQLNSR